MKTLKYSDGYYAGCRDAIEKVIQEYVKTGKESKDLSGVFDKNGRIIALYDKVRGLYLYGDSIVGICDFQNGAFGIKWMRGEIEEFTPFCCTHNIEWEVVCDGET